MKNRDTVTALTLVADFLPLNSILREERYGEPGSGKLGILRDLNCFLGGSTIDKRLRSIVPRRSVFRLKAFGWVIFGGADLRYKKDGGSIVVFGMGNALKI